MYNSDIEELMLSSSAVAIKDKSKEVAKNIVEKENIYSVARKISTVWEKRRLLMKNKGHNTDELKKWREEPFVLPVVNVASGSGTETGRPKKRLSDNPGAKTENKILDTIIKQIEDAATDQNIEPQLLLNKLVERSQTKWGKEKQTKKDVPVEDACAMIYNVNLSLQQYQKLRIIQKKFGIELPPRNEIDIQKKELMCEFKVESTKTSCEFDALLKGTIESLIKINSVSLSDDDNVHVEGKVGIDGSGSHQIRHQLAEDEEGDDDRIDNNGEKKCETSYIGIFWCPLTIKLNDSIVWSNILPNSTMYCRPLCLMREKENRESVLKHFQPYIYAVENMETPVDSNFDDHLIKLSAHTEISMVDGKMVDIIQGDSGSFCHYCNATRAQANDLTCILQGFVIEKSVEEMIEKWDAIEAGDMLYSDSERSGQCHRPMNNSTLCFFAIMHQKLRSLDNCLKLLYHLVSGQTHTWSESNANVKDAIKAAKKETIDHIRKECDDHLLVDCPTAIGGNTNTGPVADRFFSPKNRNDICSVIRKTSDQSAYSELLSNFNKMLSLTQQSDVTKVVNVEMVRILGQNLMVHFKQSFPFAMISPSVHQMAAHSWELFLMTEGRPIATYAEQSGESWNKHIRAYKSGPASRARQCSIRLNTRDIFARMLVQSHPITASKRMVLLCKRCNKHGHTVRSCPMNLATVRDNEQSFIDSCYI